MPEQASLNARYFDLIDQIIQLTLKGNIRSKEQVYQMLVQEIEPESGEIFEACLRDRTASLQAQANDASQEVKQAKAMRSLRAVKTLEGEWQRWQSENQARGAIASAVHQILQAESSDRLIAFLNVNDANRVESLNTEQLQQLATALRQQPLVSPETRQELDQIADGISQGLRSWDNVQPHLLSWLYAPEQIGFGQSSSTLPWELWAKDAIGQLPRTFFETLHRNDSLFEWASSQSDVNLADWIELALLLQKIERGLVNWAENQAYSAKSGVSLASSVFVTFGIFWSQLANGFHHATNLNTLNRDRFSEASFRVTIQGLRIFSQRDYFPLYGTVSASFTGGYFREAMNYLKEPLKRAEGKQEQARILTLIGTSQHLGELSKEIYETAMEIAQEAGDKKCEIADLNHLSRIYVNEKNYDEAISFAQRALILSRQTGDRMGEANALTNLGYSEVYQTQQAGADSDALERAIAHLEQALELAERLQDVQSKALAAISLGNVRITTGEAEQAVPLLNVAAKSAARAGDLYLTHKSFAYLAEAYYQLQQFEGTVFTGMLAMYHLEQMGSEEWRSTAGLLAILQGQLGEGFQKMLVEQRSLFLQEIGVDGYDHGVELLQRYRQGTNGA